MPAVKSVSRSGDVNIDGLLSGTQWAVNSLTFSFPSSASLYGLAYASGEPSVNFEAFNTAQQTAVRTVLQHYASVINVTFTEVVETPTQHGALRYAESDSPTTAWAYLPSSAEMGGDLWFNHSSGRYDFPVQGTYSWLTILHETGHAMGLKHPNEFGSFGPAPAEHDSLEYTVMSYRSYVGGPTTGLSNEYGGYPQTLMMYDIAALQEMYGANYTTNSGNSVYTWSPTTGVAYVNGVAFTAPAINKIFMTIWDGRRRGHLQPVKLFDWREREPSAGRMDNHVRRATCLSRRWCHCHRQYRECAACRQQSRLVDRKCDRRCGQ